ncbi:MAG: hypothetical protein LBC96_07355, partial [Lachnospiraceae bacterium]|nr:hypothetical protein [Lachnospiraceae bacterium]
MAKTLTASRRRVRVDTLLVSVLHKYRTRQMIISWAKKNVKRLSSNREITLTQHISFKDEVSVYLWQQKGEDSLAVHVGEE